MTNPGSVAFGQGISIQHLSTGTYEVTITSPACAQGSNAPVVSVSDANPPNGEPSGTFPVAWYEATAANQHFTVFTGVIVSGNFMATDHTFDIMDTCR